MSPLSWLKNLISTFFGEGKKKELSPAAKTLLEPGLPIDFKLDETWQRLHTRTRAYADEYWKIERMTDCEPVWYIRANDLRTSPLSLLYTTADGLPPEEADAEAALVIAFLAGKLVERGWRETDRRHIENGIQVLFDQKDDMRVIETKRRGNGTCLVGLYIPDAVRPQGVQIDEEGLKEG
jgi:hypothetical protein